MFLGACADPQNGNLRHRLGDRNEFIHPVANLKEMLISDVKTFFLLFSY
jgi:hypothetical protein